MTPREQTERLIEAANLLSWHGHDTAAALVMRAAHDICQDRDPRPLAHERDCSRDAGGLP